MYCAQVDSSDWMEWNETELLGFSVSRPSPPEISMSMLQMIGCAVSCETLTTSTEGDGAEKYPVHFMEFGIVICIDISSAISNWAAESECGGGKGTRHPALFASSTIIIVRTPAAFFIYLHKCLSGRYIHAQGLLVVRQAAGLAQLSRCTPQKWGLNKKKYKKCRTRTWA